MKDFGLEVNNGANSVQTNIMYINVTHHSITADELVKRMGEVADNTPENLRAAVKMPAARGNHIRLVLHHQVSKEEINKTLEKLKYILTFDSNDNEVTKPLCNGYT